MSGSATAAVSRSICVSACDRKSRDLGLEEYGLELLDRGW